MHSKESLTISIQRIMKVCHFREEWDQFIGIDDARV